jgi:hypothetical protein
MAFENMNHGSSLILESGIVWELQDLIFTMWELKETRETGIYYRDS